MELKDTVFHDMSDPKVKLSTFLTMRKLKVDLKSRIEISIPVKEVETGVMERWAMNSWGQLDKSNNF